MGREDVGSILHYYYASHSFLLSYVQASQNSLQADSVRVKLKKNALSLENVDI